MIKENLKILSNEKLSDGVYKMELQCNSINKCGQFIELTVKGFYLNRPFSVADYEKGKLTLLYKVLGQGTDKMTTLKSGEYMTALCGLGNGFDIKKSKKPLLIGGGIGIAPLYMLAKEFNKIGVKPTAILGYKTLSEIYYLDEFKALCNVIVSTDDGSFGIKGNAVSVLKEQKPDYDFYYACGPMVMLNALKEYDNNGEISLEARMGCGFGACMGCSIKTTKGNKRVCKEGPVFLAEEVL